MEKNSFSLTPVFKALSSKVTLPSLQLPTMARRRMRQMFPTFRSAGRAAGRVTGGVGGVAKDIGTAGVVAGGTGAIAIGAGLGNPIESPLY